MKIRCRTSNNPPANNKRNFIFPIDFPLHVCYTVIVPKNRKGICTMAKLTKTQLTNARRDEIIAMIAEFLTEQGEEVLSVSGNAIAFPTIDAEGHELVAKLTISIPRGDRSGEAYDAYGEAQQYKEHLEEVAANKERKEKEKQAAAKKRAEQAAERKRKKEAEEAAKAARRAEQENKGE